MVRIVPRTFGIVACLCLALCTSPVSAMQASDDLLGEGAAPVTQPPEEQGQDDLLGEVSQPDPVQAAPPPEDDTLLPDLMDPDNDDDGVQDIDDEAPEDPTVGERPAPGPTDPIADDDNDGLPNLMDPDDSNDGVPDAEEPRVVAPAPAPETPSDPVIEAPPANDVAAGVSEPSAPAGGSQAAPVVLALPKAGDGANATGHHRTVLVVGAMLLLGASGVLRHQMRHD